MNKIALIALAAMLPFIFTLGHDFTLDDLHHIEKSKQLEESSKSFSSSFMVYFEPTWPGNLYRPVVTQSFALTAYLFGKTATFFHAGNLLLHVLVSVLVYLLVAALSKARYAFIAAILFAVHPIHVEAVANISNRTELLSALGGMLALVLSLAGCSILSGAALLLGLLAKESAVCFLLLLPLVHFIKHRSISTALKPMAFCVLALIAYFGLRYQALGGAIFADHKVFFVVNPLTEVSGVERAFTAILLLGKYLILSFIPWPLTPDYSYPMLRGAFSLSLYELLPSLLGVFLLLAGLMYQRFATLWFIFGFAVTLNFLFPIGTIFAERLAYVSSMGVCFFLASEFKYHRLVQPLVGVVFAALTMLQCTYWDNNEVLFARAIQVSPNSAKANQNYAIALLNQGQLDEALVYFHNALKLYPGYADVAYRISFVYREKGMPKGVEHWLKKALEINPKHKRAKQDLLELYN